LTDELNQVLLQAYRETEYEVFAHPPFTLRVDVASTPLVDLQRRRGVGGSAYVTACNPGSRLLPRRENATRHAALRRMVKARGWISLEGLGHHPDGGWPGEPSLLLLGPSREEAIALGQKWGQLAILWSGEDGIPRLLLLP
jgi:hypothetical protein